MLCTSCMYYGKDACLCIYKVNVWHCTSEICSTYVPVKFHKRNAFHEVLGCCSLQETLPVWSHLLLPLLYHSIKHDPLSIYTCIVSVRGLVTVTITLVYIYAWVLLCHYSLMVAVCYRNVGKQVSHLASVYKPSRCFILILIPETASMVSVNTCA